VTLAHSVDLVPGINTYTHIHKRTYIHTHIYLYMYTLYIYKCIDLCIHLRMCLNEYVCACELLYACMNLFARTIYIQYDLYLCHQLALHEAHFFLHFLNLVIRHNFHLKKNFSHESALRVISNKIRGGSWLLRLSTWCWNLKLASLYCVDSVVASCNNCTLYKIQHPAMHWNTVQQSCAEVASAFAERDLLQSLHLGRDFHVLDCALVKFLESALRSFYGTVQQTE